MAARPQGVLRRPGRRRRRSLPLHSCRPDLVLVLHSVHSMITIKLDGKEDSLQLPPNCVSIAQATSYAKCKLGAGWMDARDPSPWGSTATAFAGGTLADLTNIDQSEAGVSELFANRFATCATNCHCWLALLRSSTTLPCLESDAFGGSLCFACCAGGGRPSRKRLFLSAKGWQPGGAVPEGASLLAFGRGSTDVIPSAEELPASLLLGGLLQLRAFTPGGSQARRGMRRQR